ncbi:MAG: STAS-like domain-containing protein [Methylococcales bacterium]
MAFRSEKNKLIVEGDISASDLPRLHAAMHNLTAKQGYSDFALDFSKCTRAFAGEMVSIAARCQSYWKSGVDISLTLPEEEKLNRLFVNSNWAYMIDHQKFDESRYKGFEQVPLLRFTDATEHHLAVNRILDVLMTALSGFERHDLTAIEWAVNEIADNVINHSESKVGGFVQVTHFKQRKMVEFAVCDVGIGIPGSLRKARKDLSKDQELLDAAIREGVTRDPAIGQGNGLYGTWRITQKSEGEFRIQSGYSSLTSSVSRGLHVAEEATPFVGTLVVSRIGYQKPIPLSEALTFRGQPHVPLGFIDTKYETDESGNVVFAIKEESVGFGSRTAADPVRRKLRNLASTIKSGKIKVDFSDVPLVSSSYADEVFGKLFVELGPLEFASKFEFVRIDQLVRQLIDRAIYQRMSAPNQILR